MDDYKFCKSALSNRNKDSYLPSEIKINQRNSKEALKKSLSTNVEKCNCETCKDKKNLNECATKRSREKCDCQICLSQEISKKSSKQDNWDKQCNPVDPQDQDYSWTYKCDCFNCQKIPCGVGSKEQLNFDPYFYSKNDSQIKPHPSKPYQRCCGCVDCGEQNRQNTQDINCATTYDSTNQCKRFKPTFNDNNCDSINEPAKCFPQTKSSYVRTEKSKSFYKKCREDKKDYISSDGRVRRTDNYTKHCSDDTEIEEEKKPLIEQSRKLSCKQSKEKCHEKKRISSVSRSRNRLALKNNKKPPPYTDLRSLDGNIGTLDGKCDDSNNHDPSDDDEKDYCNNGSDDDEKDFCNNGSDDDEKDYCNSSDDDEKVQRNNCSDDNEDNIDDNNEKCSDDDNNNNKKLKVIYMRKKRKRSTPENIKTKSPLKSLRKKKAKVKKTQRKNSKVEEQKNRCKERIRELRREEKDCRQKRKEEESKRREERKRLLQVRKKLREQERNLLKLKNEALTASDTRSLRSERSKRRISRYLDDSD